MRTVTCKVIEAVLVQDFVACWHGSASGCVWAASGAVREPLPGGPFLWSPLGCVGVEAPPLGCYGTVVAEEPDVVR